MSYPEIKYTDGWDYVLAETVDVKTSIYPEKTIYHKDEFVFWANGTLTIYKNYPWDGATGAFDTRNSMVASLVHDCFCEMMRVGELDYDKYSPLVHELLAKIARYKGMSNWRAAAWEWATKKFRGGHPSHPDSHPVKTA